EAIDLLGKALAIAPESADAHLMLAQLFQISDALESALPHFRAAAACAAPNNANGTLAWALLGETLELLGYCTAAVEAYEKFDESVWEQNPEHTNAPAVRAVLDANPRGTFERRLRLLQRLSRKDDALRLTKWALGHWPEDVAVACAHAEALLAAGRAAEAFEFGKARLGDPASTAGMAPIVVRAARDADRLAEWLDEILATASAGPVPPEYIEVARLLVNLDEYAAATRLAAGLSRAGGGLGSLAWDLALAQLAHDEPARAAATLAAWVRANPRVPPPERRWLEWCEAARRHGDFEAWSAAIRAGQESDFADDFVVGMTAAGMDRDDLAEPALAACLKKSPNYEPALGLRGRVLLARADWNAALDYAQALLKNNSKLACAWVIIAQAHDGLDENDRADEAYKRAAALAPSDATARIAFGAHARRLGDRLTAQRYFAEAIAADPTRAEAHEGLLDAYVQDRKLALAREHFKQMSKLNLPPDALRRADILIRHLDDPGSDAHRAELQAQFESNPRDVDTAKVLAGLLTLLGRESDAVDVCERALRVAPGDYNLLILRSDLHRAAGDFDRALEILDRLEKRHPNRQAVLERLVVACHGEFQMQRAEQILRRLASKETDRWEQYHQALLEQFERLGEFEKALALLDDSLKATPGDPKRMLLKVGVLILADRPADATKLLTEFLDAAPNAPERRKSFVELGREARAYDEVEKRIRDWMKNDAPDTERQFYFAEQLVGTLIAAEKSDAAMTLVQELKPDGIAQVFFQRVWMGDVHAGARRYDKAIAEYEALLSESWVRGDHRFDLYQKIINALVASQQFDRALETCERAIKQLADLGSEVEWNLIQTQGDIHQAAGREREYAQILERIWRRNRASPGLNNDLGYTWLELGMNYEQAFRMIRRAVAADPLRAAYLDSLGWAHYKLGRFDQAYAVQSRSVRLRAGNDADQYDHFGDIAWRLNKREEAVKHWKTALELLEKEKPLPARAAMRAALGDRIRRKTEAAAGSGTVPVAPTAAELENKNP
ncbi:MAG: tetratricopeptide repeat protein, partial [Planctomycetes bacterium]|nr:tetratricopeptide repeat protein [Planctomycetota bacterium]